MFEVDRPSVLGKLTGTSVKRVLNVECPRRLKRAVDFLFVGMDDKIHHLEFQARNFKKIVYREGVCCFLIGESHPGMDIEQTVLYLGRAKMKMPNSVSFGKTSCTFRLVDIRDIRVEDLLASGNPADLALAILAGGGTEQVPEILRRVKRLRPDVRERVAAQIVVLSGLRRLEGRVQLEMKNMGVAIDVENNPLLAKWHREAMDKGRSEGMAALVTRLLSEKFERLPKWAQRRVDSGSPKQLERWATRVLTADSLEGVIGKR
jgi:hypothetical protein